MQDIKILCRVCGTGQPVRVVRYPKEAAVYVPSARRLLLVLCLIGVLFGAAACFASPTKPIVIISAPPHGSQFHEGEDIAVQSTATDAKGIARVELLVNGAVVRTDTVPSPQGQTSFTLVQSWKAVPGTHNVAVRAVNTTNVTSDQAVISITVIPATTVVNTTVPPVVSASPTATSVVPPPASATATATATTAPPPPGACTNGLQFIADVTVPDGTLLAPAQAFNKIWRVKNTGTCNWDATYQFVYVGGDAMAAVAAIAVPYTAPGATADLLIAMTAPSTAGTHISQWRMKSGTGALFGATLTVNINVIGAQPPPPPSGTCTGTPNIDSFTATPGTINAGQTSTLQWGMVTNADSVEIDQGIGGIATPGSTTVSPGSTTTYTLTAHCGATVTTKQATVTVQTVGPPPTAPDLYVSEYSLNPATPVQGQNVHVRVGVYNKGSAAAGAFNVEWWASTGAASAAKVWSVSGLPKNGGQILEFDYTYPSWYANITTRVKVDPANAVAESDETNNIKDMTIQVTQPKPDLYVKSFSLIPNPPSHTGNVSVTIVVHNGGNAAAGGFTVAWYAGSGYATPACTPNAPGLAAGADVTMGCSRGPGTWGSFYSSITTRVIVDPTNAVSESNETNNTYDLVIKVN